MNIRVRGCTVSLELKREGDSFIIDTFRHNGYSDDQLQLLNMVRIYTKVTTLSDMVSGDGRYLLAFVFWGWTVSFGVRRGTGQSYLPLFVGKLAISRISTSQSLATMEKSPKEVLSPFQQSSIGSTAGGMDKERCEMGSGVGSI